MSFSKHWQLACGAGARRVIDRPHAFEVVVLATFGAEDMHDDVAGIDQNPIALTRAIDRPRAVASLFQTAREMLRHRGDMARRTPGRDHDRVAERGASGEVDGGDVLGLVVVERFQDAGEQRRFGSWRRLFLLRGGFLRYGLLRRALGGAGRLPRGQVRYR